MKYAHSIKLNVFSYENENSQSIGESFLRFFPFNLKENKNALNKTKAEGFNERNLVVFEITLAKTNLINQFLGNLLINLGERQKQQLLNQAESRLDKNLDFFLRFDKNSWVNDKKLVLTDSGKCFHLKISIAAFPKKREVALNLVRNLFEKRKIKYGKAPEG